MVSETSSAAASAPSISTLAQHTPGPWLAAAKPSSVVGWPIVQQGVGRSICNVTYVQHSKIDPAVPGDRAFNAESEANARLIAAAPDLLATLQTLMGLSQAANGISEKNFVAAYQAAEDAIAKATGGA
jgi:hypothetical protein